VFGFPTAAFKVESIFGFLLFHGLVWAALLVIAGVMIAMHRRMRDEGATTLQFFREDILPLVLLFAVSLTGLLLTVSSTLLPKPCVSQYLMVEPGAFYVMDRGSLDLSRLYTLHQAGAYFVIRARKDLRFVRYISQPNIFPRIKAGAAAFNRGKNLAVAALTLSLLQWFVPKTVKVKPTTLRSR
jgi:hypothetical protein